VPSLLTTKSAHTSTFTYQQQTCTVAFLQHTPFLKLTHDTSNFIFIWTFYHTDASEFDKTLSPADGAIRQSVGNPEGMNIWSINGHSTGFTLYHSDREYTGKDHGILIVNSSHSFCLSLLYDWFYFWLDSGVHMSTFHEWVNGIHLAICGERFVRYDIWNEACHLFIASHAMCVDRWVKFRDGCLMCGNSPHTVTFDGVGLHVRDKFLMGES